MADNSWIGEYLDAWSAHDGAAVASFMADDVVFEEVTFGEVCHGPAEVQAFADGVADTFSSDYRFVLDSGYSTDSWFAAEWTISGTHDGTSPELPPTGRRFSLRGASVGTLRDGKIAVNHDYWNMADFLAQVGLLPTAETA